jgi:hypothetical protein
VAHAAEAIAAALNVGREHRLNPAAQRKIRMTNNAGAMPCFALDAAATMLWPLLVSASNSSSS